jgi:hypothetical protein
MRCFGSIGVIEGWSGAERWWHWYFGDQWNTVRMSLIGAVFCIEHNALESTRVNCNYGIPSTRTPTQHDTATSVRYERETTQVQRNLRLPSRSGEVEHQVGLPPKVWQRALARDHDSRNQQPSTQPTH